MNLSASSLPIDLMRPTPQISNYGSVTDPRARIEKTAKEFESVFLSTAFQTMFSGVNTSEPFGGGQGEQAFKSFLMDAFAKQMTKAGGVGIAASVTQEMLKMQGLSPTPAVQEPVK
jgi:Rod binding domain-containing protein